MAQATFVQEGALIDYTPGSAVSAGNVVVQGGMVGVANLDIAANQLGALAVAGVFDVVKEEVAITAGADVWWRPTGDPYGGTADSGAASPVGGSAYLGKAVVAAASTDSTVRVRLQQEPVQSPFEHTIADPGASGAIPVTDSGMVPIVTAGAETRTVANPAKAGLMLGLNMKTDGGDCTVTVASAINATGNNTITLNDAGDVITLLSVANGSNFRWTVIANSGTTLSTV